MLQDIVTKGSTNRSVTVTIIDETAGTPETGVVWNTSGIDLWYRREGAAKTSITEATLAALTTAHTDGGFLHVGNGVYRLDLPDAAFATAAQYVDFGGTVTGMIVIGGRVRLVDYDLETALPANFADITITASTGKLHAWKLDSFDSTAATEIDAIDTVVDAIKAVTDLLPDSGALSSLATAANLATVDTVVDTNQTLIGVALTNQTTIDTVVDAIKAVTDAIPDSGAMTSIATAASIAALNDIAATDIVSAGAITTASGAVSSVTTVATTTTNTDMRGTDSAATAANLALTDTAVDTNQVLLGVVLTNQAAIEADTNELQTNQGNWLTATGFATSSSLATAQADLDIITGADGVNLLSATQASIDAIEADTNILQAEWANGGRLDAMLDVTLNTLNIVGGYVSTTIPAQIAALNNVAATDIVSAGAITTLAGAVANVDLVDTLTTYTGNTVQTADVATLITTVGTAGDGLTAIPDLDLNADQSGVTIGTVNALASGERDAIAAALLDLAAGVETSVTVRESLRLMASALGGKVSGADSNAPVFRDVGDTKDVITSTTDANGNRTAVTTDLT